jgi:hypothetical protein
MTSDRLMEAYLRYKHMDELFLRWREDRELGPPFQTVGDLWIAIKMEVEHGDDGK